MAKFVTDLITARRWDSWVLQQDLVFESDVFGGTITVPAGFKTDFASVPRVPFAFWLTGDTAHQAAVVHDYLYVCACCTKEKADFVFLEAMEVLEIPNWRRQIMYRAVQWFGRGNFEAQRNG